MNVIQTIMQDLQPRWKQAQRKNTLTDWHALGVMLDDAIDFCRSADLPDALADMTVLHLVAVERCNMVVEAMWEERAERLFDMRYAA